MVKWSNQWKGVAIENGALRLPSTKSLTLLISFLHKNAASHIEDVLKATLYKAAALRPPTTHHENYPK